MRVRVVARSREEADEERDGRRELRNFNFNFNLIIITSIYNIYIYNNDNKAFFTSGNAILGTIYGTLALPVLLPPPLPFP